MWLLQVSADFSFMILDLFSLNASNVAALFCTQQGCVAPGWVRSLHRGEAGPEMFVGNPIKAEGLLHLLGFGD